MAKPDGMAQVPLAQAGSSRYAIATGHECNLQRLVRDECFKPFDFILNTVVEHITKSFDPPFRAERNFGRARANNFDIKGRHGRWLAWQRANVQMQRDSIPIPHKGEVGDKAVPLTP